MQNRELFENLACKRLDFDFYQNETSEVAKLLIGKVLVKQTGDSLLTGIISEAEAYISQGDAASHSACGQTKRNEAMFFAGSTVYVYKIYGIHYCINVVTEPEGVGAAVLLRAVIPTYGIEIMSENRGICRYERLCSGPGNLTQAFGIDLSHNTTSFLSDELFISSFGGLVHPEIIATERIGITKSSDLKLRFLLKNVSYFLKNYKI
ncbi:MAG: DNA-3-methyladenine glycosylase [Candidatus Kapabacteria bacterium]|nr:DNA-3-methyladenine glycosylase [Ignavibacteriota bacterium]MCW5885630.1 DNA-3-methyladenine glycosylase [Candidatus Kapabacteria bacterium]